MSRPLIVAHTGTGGERGRIMSPDGISVALSATDYKDPPKVLVEEKVNGRQNNRSRLTEPGKRSPGQGPSFIGGGQFRTKDIRNQGKERRYCRPGLRG